jgi:hypothetical protein
MILTPAEGFSVDDHLMFGINESLAVVPLDDAMGRLHFGRLVIGEVTADLLARGPVLGVIILEPLLQTLGLLLETLHLALSVSSSSRTWRGTIPVILLHVLCQ